MITTSTILIVLIPSLAALLGMYLNHTRISRMFKENELIKVINSKNVDIDKINTKYDNLWTKFEKLNEVVKELNVAFIRLNSINFTYPFPFMLKDKTGKIIINGDNQQRDSHHTKTGLDFAIELSKNIKGIGWIKLKENHRSGLVGEILDYVYGK